MTLNDKLQRQTLGLITETISMNIVRQHQVRPRAPCSEGHLFKTVDNQAGAQRRRRDLPEGVSSFHIDVHAWDLGDSYSRVSDGMRSRFCTQGHQIARPSIALLRWFSACVMSPARQSTRPGPHGF